MNQPNIPPPPDIPLPHDYLLAAEIPKVEAPKLGRIKNPTPLPPRIVLNAVEGWGKTTCGAYSPEPALIQGRGESGYQTLLSRGLVPEIDTATCNTWEEVLALLDDLIQRKKIPYKTLICDAP